MPEGKFKEGHNIDEMKLMNDFGFAMLIRGEGVKALGSEQMRLS